MADFSLEAGMLTVALPMAWALRIRVNMSAMGSVMLMCQTFEIAPISVDRNLGL